MTIGDLTPLLPLLIIAYGALMVLLVGAFWRSHAGIAILTLATLAGACLAAVWVAPLAPRAITSLLRVDLFGLFFLALFAALGFALVIFSFDYLAAIPSGRERYYTLLLLAILGMGLLVESNHLVAFFLGLETLTVSLYGLIGFTYRRVASLEASLKYLVLAGVSASFLLLGMALIYLESGRMQFQELALWMQAYGRGAQLPPLTLLGFGLILVGFAFKLAIAPFHAWAPDVYQGAPAPVSALVAAGSKAAVFALLVRFTALFALGQQGPFFLLLELLAIMTMFSGNLLALLQRNIKRMLAYSSIAHVGYLLIPLLAGGAGVPSIAFYLVSYSAATVGAFGVIAALSRSGEEMEALEDYRGLASHRPLLAAALGLMMLSLAGIPLTIGFMAKFYIFAAAATSGLWALLVIGLLNSGMAAYYYLRVLVAIYLRPAPEGASAPPVRMGSALALAAVSALVLFFGVYPGPLVAASQWMWRENRRGAIALQDPEGSVQGPRGAATPLQLPHDASSETPSRW